MRQAFTRKHAESQLHYLWRPVVVVTLTIILVSCNQEGSSHNVVGQSTQSSDVSLQTAKLISESATVVQVMTETPTHQELIIQTPEPTTTPVPTKEPAPVIESGVSAQSVHQSGGSISGRVTGYYCSQIEGYTVGDGGGYCGNMASGVKVFAGAAACGYHWATGQRLNVDGYGEVTCLDRGNLEFTQVDIFFATNKAFDESGVSSNHRLLTPVP